MNSKYATLFLSIAVCFVFSQNLPKEKTFKFSVNGSIRNLTGTKIYLHHKWNDLDYTDSAIVKNGKFTFSLKSVEPNLFWFTLSKDINAQPNFMFFADEHSINATLIADSLYYSNVEGGQVQKDYLEYRILINNFVMIQQKMQADYNTAIQKQDVNTQTAIQNEYQNLNNQYIEGLKSFIKNHPKSAVSGYIIFLDLNNPNIPINIVEECLSYYDISMVNTKFYKLARKRIDDAKGTTVGYKAINFSQNTPEGVPISLSSFKGKYVLIDFWASWCKPCRMENPNVVAAYNRFKDKGFTVLGISLDDNKERWVAAINQDNLTWKHISDLKGWGNEVGKMYGVTGIPQNYLIDKDGIIVAKNLRGAALEEKLIELIK